MKTFKNFLKKEIGIFPSPVHFRYITTPVNITTPVIRENQVYDPDDPKLTGSWLKDKGENGGKSVDEMSKLLSGRKGDRLVPNGSYFHKFIQEYTDDSGINEALHEEFRTGKKLTRRHRKLRNALEEITQIFPLNRNLTVWSGIGHDPREHVDEKGVIRSPAFISATHCKDTAIKYAMWNTDAQNEDRKKRREPPERTLHLLQINLHASKDQTGDLAHFVGARSDHPHEHETIIHPVSFKYLRTETHTLHKPNGVAYTTHIHHMKPYYPS